MADEIDEKHEKFVADQLAAGRCCGACEMFDNEDMSGAGWCHFKEGGTTCGDTCRHWTDLSPERAELEKST